MRRVVMRRCGGDALDRLARTVKGERVAAGLEDEESALRECTANFLVFLYKKKKRVNG